jgi:hypothetical protein
MINKNNLTNNIETLREQLYSLLTLRGLTDTIVVECSQKLDNLLTEYEKYKLNSPQSNN